jgi:hypothetical protein
MNSIFYIVKEGNNTEKDFVLPYTEQPFAVEAKFSETAVNHPSTKNSGKTILIYPCISHG